MAAEYQIELRDFTTGTRLAWLSGSTGSGRGVGGKDRRERFVVRMYRV